MANDGTQRKIGRPLEWILEEEIIEAYKLILNLEKQNPNRSLTEVLSMVKAELTRKKRQNLLNKIDQIISLLKLLIPSPPRCICGGKKYVFTFREKGMETNHSWEVFARCVNPNCRYLRRYMPWVSYKWSRLKPAFKELPPTFYEMDGQLVEKPK